MGNKETPTKRQKRGGYKALRGAEDGTPFTPTKQPTPAQKRAGWAKKRTGQELIKFILDSPFKGTPEMRKKISEYFGVPEEYISTEAAILYRQAQKAVQSADTQAAKLTLERRHGAPKQEVELSGDIQGTVINQIIIENPHKADGDKAEPPAA